jgi:uncharacterized protein HemX
MKYSDPGPGWTIELIVTFVLGFVLATALWVGVWFFWAKPARATALQKTETALRARETALQECVAAKDQCNELKNRMQAENTEMDAKLKQALAGWGRCLKTKKAEEEKLQP